MYPSPRSPRQPPAQASVAGTSPAGQLQTVSHQDSGLLDMSFQPDQPTQLEPGETRRDTERA